MTGTERAAYIKGLAEGLGIDDSTKEGKIINALIGAIEDLALTVSDLEAMVDEMAEQVDTIDEDLGTLEADCYGLDDDEDDDDCGCGHHHHHHAHHHGHVDDEFDEYFDGDLYEVCCPVCGDVVCIDSEMLEEGQTTCPNCGELLEFDLEEDEKIDQPDDSASK